MLESNSFDLYSFSTGKNGNLLLVGLIKRQKLEKGCHIVLKGKVKSLQLKILQTERVYGMSEQKELSYTSEKVKNMGNDVLEVEFKAKDITRELKENNLNRTLQIFNS